MKAYNHALRALTTTRGEDMTTVASCPRCRDGHHVGAVLHFLHYSRAAWCTRCQDLVPDLYFPNVQEFDTYVQTYGASAVDTRLGHTKIITAKSEGAS